LVQSAGWEFSSLVGCKAGLIVGVAILVGAIK